MAQRFLQPSGASCTVHQAQIDSAAYAAEAFSLAGQPFFVRRLSDGQAFHKVATNKVGRLLQRILVVGTSQRFQPVDVNPRRSMYPCDGFLGCNNRPLVEISKCASEL